MPARRPRPRIDTTRPIYGPVSLARGVETRNMGEELVIAGAASVICNFC